MFCPGRCLVAKSGSAKMSAAKRRPQPSALATASPRVHNCKNMRACCDSAARSSSSSSRAVKACAASAPDSGNWPQQFNINAKRMTGTDRQDSQVTRIGKVELQLFGQAGRQGRFPLRPVDKPNFVRGQVQIVAQDSANCAPSSDEAAGMKLGAEAPDAPPFIVGQRPLQSAEALRVHSQIPRPDVYLCAAWRRGALIRCETPLSVDNVHGTVLRPFHISPP